MRKKLFLLTCALLATVFSFADGPFRNHRYDAFKVLPVNSEQIVFVGNSITNMHEWWEAFGNHNVVNRGVSGAITDEALSNIEAVVAGKPKKVFFLLGTNDLGTSGINTTEHVLTNMTMIVERFKQTSPETELYIQSILPSTSGIRTLDILSATNTALKAFCTENGVTYIDLWDSMMGITTNTLSYDKLHLTAAGYQVWCDIIAPYVMDDENATSVYPSNTINLQKDGGQGGSYGMRNTVFSMLPVDSDDILIIGDEMVHGGEWHELLQSDRVKSRGTAWGYPGPSLAQVLAEIPVILHDNATPAQIFLYTGVGEVNGSNDLASLFTTYKSIVAKIQELSPATKVTLMSLQPTSTAATNTNRVAPFNELIKGYAEESATDKIEYLDIYTDFLNGTVANTAYFNGNYLYGKGYVEVAQKIAAAIGDAGIVALTDEQANAAYTRFANRTALGNAITAVAQLPEGNGVGEYTTENIAAVKAIVSGAYAALASSTNASDAFTDQVNALTAATTELLPKINMPVASTEGNEVWYQLSTPQRGNRYLSSMGVGSQVLGKEQNNFERSMWKFTSRGNGTYNIINRKDGSYLNPSAGYNTAISTSETEPANGWSLSYSNTVGLYIINSGTVQLNQTQENLGWKVYNWSAGQSGTDRSDTGCQYRISLVTGEPDVETILPNQIENISDLVNGWYRIVAVEGTAGDMTNAINAGKNHIVNATTEYRQNASNFYPLKYAAYDESNPVMSYVYVTKSGNNYYLTSLNGHKLNENFTASRAVPGSLTAISGSNGVFTIGKTSAYNTGTAESPYVGKYSNSTTKYNIFKTTEEQSRYTIYNVVMNGADNAAEIGSDVKLTCTNAAVKGLASVFNGGCFFVPAGTTITPADFTPGAVDGKNAQITISGNTITVEYIMGSYAALGTKIEEATSLLENTTAGNDPACFSVSDRTALQAAINEAVTKNNTTGLGEAEISAAIDALNAAITAYNAARNDVKYSTTGNVTWYYIVSASEHAYCSGKAIKKRDAQPLTYAPKALDPTMVWCFEKNADGKVAIRNYAGGYMSKIQDKNNAAAGMVDAPAYNYTISRYTQGSIGDRGYIIKSDASGNPIHAQEANTVIVTWAAAANNASLWGLHELTAAEVESQITITGSTVQLANIGTGIGNEDVALLRATFTAEGLNGTKNLEGIKGSMNSDVVTKVRVYSVPDQYEYRIGKDNATFLGEATPGDNGNFTIQFANPVALKTGSSDYLWVTADISDDAEEGDAIDAAITSYIVAGEEIAEANGNPQYTTTVFLSASTVEYLNTYDSRYYRIPAITTAVNGWLVAVTDKRWGSNGDLPNNIDVVARVSKDNGATWSEPVTIAGTAELGGDYGHGDPAIVTDMVTGDIFVLVCSKEGFFYGTPQSPQLIKVIASHDNGETWDAPVDITNQLYGAGCSDSERSTIHALFPSSGSFMQTKDGTLMCVAPTRPTSNTSHGTFQARIISSSDHGATWTLSNNYALLDADESKIVELDNGDLLVSSRHAWYRYYAVSSDGGATWSDRATWSDLYEPGCNGDLLRLTSLSGGSNKNRLLHTIPNASSRQSVTIFLSTDEGQTWPTKKVICPKGSAYSSLTVLPDGTIGCYYEEDGLEGGYQMRYVRFSLSWMTDGADSITADDVSTSIGCIKEVETPSTVADNNIYDLMGNRVLYPVKGRIYIQNNKKFIAR